MAPLSTLPLALALAAAAAAKSPSGREHSRASDAARAAMRDEAAAPHASPRAIGHYLRARVALVRGDEQEALREMDLAMAFDPSSAGLRAGAADLLLAIGKVGRAAGEAHRAIDLAEREPDAAARGHAVLGRIAAAESRWPAAAAELDAAARLADAPPTAGVVAVSQEDRFVLGVALEALRRWDDAATAFARAASGDDDGIGALSLLRQAHALTRARRHDDALELLARSRRAGDVRFATAQAFVLGRAGRSDDAAAALRAEIAARGADDPEADAAAVGDLVESLGAILVEAGRPQDAVSELERALATWPGERRLVIGLANALERAGDVEGAVARATELLADDPGDVEAMNFVGYLLADRGLRLDDAERLLVRAAELAPTEGAVQDSLGWLWLRKGQTDRAIRTLERAESLAGPDATILEHLGDAYRAGRRDAEAARAWRRALAELEADPPVAAGEAQRARAQRDAITRKLEGLAAARAVR